MFNCDICNIICDICNIFNKDKDKNRKFIKIDETYSLNIILNELNDKLENAEKDYSKNPSGDNLIKCINARNMRNNFLLTNKNKFPTQINIINTNTKNITTTTHINNYDEEDLC